MLLELAIADAYSAGFKYSEPTFVLAYNDLRGYVEHPLNNLKPGCYTDDDTVDERYKRKVKANKIINNLTYLSHSKLQC